MRFNPPIPREFVEPSESTTFIFWLFKGRCIICNQQASEINHIIPRSRDESKIHDWKNLVTLCQSDHRSYHDGGVTDDKIKEMQSKRESFLYMIGRKEYIHYEENRISL